MSTEYHYDWQIDLRSSPRELWPLAADTNRFNRDTGLPRIRAVSDLTGVPAGVRRLAFDLPVYTVEWDEEPFNWVYPHQFSVIRRYRNGPMTEMRVLCEFQPQQSGGTHLRYQTWVRPRNLAGDLAIQVGIGLVSARLFMKVFRNYDDNIQRGGTEYSLSGPIHLAPGGLQRLQAARAGLVRNATDAALFEKFSALLIEADDLSLERLRPYHLATLWGLTGRETLEFCLRLNRAGLFDLRWELLCPMCRGAQETHANLAEVHAHAHCNSCHIDFTVDFDHQVEVIFRPNPAIRRLPAQQLYCLAGPQLKPHLLLNEALAPGESRVFQVELETGEHFLLSSLDKRALSVTVGEEGLDSQTLTPTLPAAALRLSPHPTLELNNPTTETAVFSIERTAWRDDAATAADVTTLQLFRDLFPREALRAGQEISVSHVTLMFTDLRDSTRMYRQIGDGPAFGHVRRHFDILQEAVAAEGGAVVKTIGDAVMAVFRQPLHAFLALQTALARISEFESDPALYLKAGIHSGPCIVVTLNERLDYFGTTVNIAARLPGMSSGGEVVFSDEVASDPEVAKWLAASLTHPAHFAAELKGFDEPFSLWRANL